jgi:DNA-binding response OmpR family regulator
VKYALLLEDDEERATMLTEALYKHNYSVLRARTVSEAKVIWRDRKLDLVLLDHDLGQPQDGCHFVCWLVQQPDLRRTHFIVADLHRAGADVIRLWPTQVPDYLDAVEN